MRRARAHAGSIVADRNHEYRRWLEARTPGNAELEQMRAQSAAFSGSRFALLVACRGDGTSRTVDSIVRQTYPHWEAWIWRSGEPMSPALAEVVQQEPRFKVLGAELTSEADARNAIAIASRSDFLLAVDDGDALVPEALFELAAAAARFPGAGLVYSDEDRFLPDGPADPDFKPGWSPELLLSRMYLGRLLAVRALIVAAVGGYRPGIEGAHDYDMALRATAAGAEVVHVPKVLYHRSESNAKVSPASRAAERRALENICEQTGRNASVIPGAVSGIWRVRHQAESTARVTIVIPTDAQTGATLSGRQPLVTQCIRSILERTSYQHYDLLIVDNGQLPADAAALLSGVPHERISYRWTGPFNFSRKINFAVAHTASELVLLLNDDIEVINPGWLDAMLEYGRQEAVGAVGAKLFYPDGRLQHIGVATGVCGIAAHLFHQHPGGSTGCGYAAVAVRNCSAVTGACLLTRRAVYDRVGGFDERMAVDFNDVDFCLKVREAGYRIVFTPYARLYHHESGSFGSRVQHPRDTLAMRQIWGRTLDDDPYYNPNFSREFPDCRLRRDES